MRTEFEAALIRDPIPNRFRTLGDADAFKQGTMFWAKDWGIFMAFWYGGLYVVIEGWQELKLNDDRIDPMLESSNVALLKRFRNGAYHFQKNWFDDRFTLFISSETSVEWVRALSSEFGGYFLRRHAEQKDDGRSPSRPQ